MCSTWYSLTFIFVVRLNASIFVVVATPYVKLRFAFSLKGFGASKDCLVLLVDCSQRMFTPSNGEVPFQLTMKVRGWPGLWSVCVCV